MRISFIVPRFPPYVGGVEQHSKNIVENLSSMGVEVIVHTLDTNENLRQKLERGVEFTTENLPTGVVKKTYSLNKLNRIEAPPYKKIVDNIKKEKPDIVHLQMYHQPLAALTQRNIDFPPTVFTPHYHGIGKNAFTTMLHKPWSFMAGNNLFTKTTKIIAVSDSEKKLILKDFPFAVEKVITIPNGVANDRNIYYSKTTKTEKDAEQEKESFAYENFILNIDYRKPTLLYVGRVEKYKNVDTLMRYCSTQNWNLIIVGHGPYCDNIQRLNNSLENKAYILGSRTDSEIEYLLARSDCYVSLSSQEAFGLNIAQYSSQAIPVVCSDIEAHRYVRNLDTESNIQLVDMNSKESFINAVEKAIKSKRTAAKNPTWRELAQETFDVYKKIAK